MKQIKLTGVFVKILNNNEEMATVYSLEEAKEKFSLTEKEVEDMKQIEKLQHGIVGWLEKKNNVTEDDKMIQVRFHECEVLENE